MNKTHTSKAMIVAVAAFLLSSSSVHAFSSPEILISAGLTDEQAIAVQEAQELKAVGDVTAAHKTLQSAGVDQEVLRSVKAAMREAKQAVRIAIQDNDWEAFQIAAFDSPLADVISTEDAFRDLVTAHTKRFARDHWDGRALGTNHIGRTQAAADDRRQGVGWPKARSVSLLTDEQLEAVQVARRANDSETVKAIYDEAGIEFVRHQHKRKS